jgi:hypothetical protein
LLAPVAMAWLVWGVAPAQATTQTFAYTGGEQVFVVPAGVTTLHVVAIGGAGGPSEFAGGVAAQVIGDIVVTPGQTLYVEVGGKGNSAGLGGGLGGFNGGGDGGGIGAGGGGGASDVRTVPLASGLAPDRRLIVAGGGGGTGGNGEISVGGVGGAAGSNGAETTTGNPGGNAGTEKEGGAGGIGFFGTGGNGELGLGGAGGASEVSGGPGGGGGGGYYGGGGGGGGFTSGGGGGGGGSSLVPPGGKSELVSLATEPQIEIVYTPSASTGPPTNVEVPPNTVLGFHPPKTVKTGKKKVKVKFTFSSNVAGATFKCKLDKGAFAKCISPKTYKVKPGKHKFSVEAVSAGGTDSSPAIFSFSVKKKH